MATSFERFIEEYRIPINTHNLINLANRFRTNMYPSHEEEEYNTNLFLRQFGTQIAAMSSTIDLQLQKTAFQIEYANITIEFTALLMVPSMIVMGFASFMSSAVVVLDNILLQIVAEATLNVFNGFISAFITNLLAQASIQSRNSGFDQDEHSSELAELTNQSWVAGALGGLFGYITFGLHNGLLNHFGSLVSSVSNVAASVETSLMTSAAVASKYNQKFDINEAAISGAVMGAVTLPFGVINAVDYVSQHWPHNRVHIGNPDNVPLEEIPHFNHRVNQNHVEEQQVAHEQPQAIQEVINPNVDNVTNHDNPTIYTNYTLDHRSLEENISQIPEKTYKIHTSTFTTINPSLHTIHIHEVENKIYIGDINDPQLNLVKDYPDIPHIETIFTDNINDLKVFIDNYSQAEGDKNNTLLFVNCESKDIIVNAEKQDYHSFIISTSPIKQNGKSITADQFILHYKEDNVKGYIKKYLGTDLVEGLEKISAITEESVHIRFDNAYKDANYSEHEWGINDEFNINDTVKINKITRNGRKEEHIIGTITYINNDTKSAFIRFNDEDDSYVPTEVPLSELEYCNHRHIEDGSNKRVKLEVNYINDELHEIIINDPVYKNIISTIEPLENIIKYYTQSNYDKYISYVKDRYLLNVESKLSNIPYNDNYTALYKNNDFLIRRNNIKDLIKKKVDDVINNRRISNLPINIETRKLYESYIDTIKVIRHNINTHYDDDFNKIETFLDNLEKDNIIIIDPINQILDTDQLSNETINTFITNIIDTTNLSSTYSYNHFLSMDIFDKILNRTNNESIFLSNNQIKNIYYFSNLYNNNIERKNIYENLLSDIIFNQFDHPLLNSIGYKKYTYIELHTLYLPDEIYYIKLNSKLTDDDINMFISSISEESLSHNMRFTLLNKNEQDMRINKAYSYISNEYVKRHIASIDTKINNELLTVPFNKLFNNIKFDDSINSKHLINKDTKKLKINLKEIFYDKIDHLYITQDNSNPNKEFINMLQSYLDNNLQDDTTPLDCIKQLAYFMKDNDIYTFEQHDFNINRVIKINSANFIERQLTFYKTLFTTNDVTKVTNDIKLNEIQEYIISTEKLSTTDFIKHIEGYIHINKVRIYIDSDKKLNQLIDNFVTNEISNTLHDEFNKKLLDTIKIDNLPLSLNIDNLNYVIQNNILKDNVSIYRYLSRIEDVNKNTFYHFFDKVNKESLQFIEQNNNIIIPSNIKNTFFEIVNESVDGNNISITLIQEDLLLNLFNKLSGEQFASTIESVLSHNVSNNNTVSNRNIIDKLEEINAIDKLGEYLYNRNNQEAILDKLYRLYT